MPGFEKGFTSLNKEFTLKDLPLIGSIPNWLNGDFFLTGPAQFETTHEQFQHWFDGQAMIHKVSFSGKKISYQNRFISSPSRHCAQETGKIMYHEFATAPRLSFPELLKQLFKKPTFAQNPNAGLSFVNNRLLALSETPEYTIVHQESLDSTQTRQRPHGITYDRCLPHLHRAPNDNTVSYKIAIQFGVFNHHYHILKVTDTDHQEELLTSIPVKKPAYLHDFAVTRNFIILVECPLRINPLAFRLTKTPFISNYHWNSSELVKFTIINRESGKSVTTCSTLPFLMLHIINAFEDKNGKLHLDLPVYADTTIIRSLYLRNLAALEGDIMPHNEVRRYTIAPETSSIDYKLINKNFLEFPTINSQKAGLDYDYCYGISFQNDKPGDFFNILTKLNTRTGKERVILQDNCYYCAPAFIPNPKASAEDDGMVVCPVLDGNRETSYLLLVDAASFREKARIPLPHHIPFGIHGIWRQNCRSS